MKKGMAAWLALGIITLFAGFALAMVNQVTKDIIIQQEADAKVEARKEVLPLADSFDAVEGQDIGGLSELHVGKKGDAVEGYVGSVSVKGYGGPIEVTVGIGTDGKLTGLSVGGAAFAETAGLGAKAKDEAFTAQFKGKEPPVKLAKDVTARTDNSVDVITAATITSNAVNNGVDEVAEVVERLFAKADSQAAGPAISWPAEVSSSAKGYGGPVAVTITVNDDQTIAAITVGDEDFAETAGLGTKVQDEAFTSLFIGKKVPLQKGDVDVIAGATVSSQAVISAVNKAAEKLSASAAPAAPAISWPAEVSSSAKGYGGPVAVTITVNDDQTIAAITVGDEDFAETAGLGTKVQDEAFTSLFIGKTVPLQKGDVDVIAGATVSSEAVISAVNKAAEKLSASAAPAAPAISWPAEVSSSAKGYGGPVAVTITVNEDQTIAAITVGDEDFAETAGLGTKVQDEAFTSLFIGKKVPLQKGDVDVIAGATVSSEAVISAVNKAAEKLSASAAPAAPVISWPAEVSSSAKGYGGPVAVTITVNEDQTIAAITVGDEDFAETAGLGTKVQEEAFTSLFIGKKVPLQKGDVDVIGGATVSSQAVINAVNKAAEKLSAPVVPAAPAATEAPVVTWPAEVSSSAKGYGGPVAVRITVNEDRTIAAITVGDEDFAETAGLGTKVQDEAFTGLFVGKKVPLQKGDVDVIAGATVSSQAVINAVNKAADKLPESPAAEPEAALSWPMEVSSSAKGYGGPVAVRITVNEDRTIAAITVGDEDFAETAGLGTKVQDEAFTSLFIGKAVPLQKGDIDVISGSTVSSEAVINAVNKAADKLPK